MIEKTSKEEYWVNYQNSAILLQKHFLNIEVLESLGIKKEVAQILAANVETFNAVEGFIRAWEDSVNLMVGLRKSE